MPFGQVLKFVTAQARATNRLGRSAVAHRLDTRFLAHQPTAADVFHFDKTIVDLGWLEV